MSEQKPKKILIVDDEPDVADLVSYHLKAKGYQVETVNNPNVSLGVSPFVPSGPRHSRHHDARPQWHPDLPHTCVQIQS